LLRRWHIFPDGGGGGGAPAARPVRTASGLSHNLHLCFICDTIVYEVLVRQPERKTPLAKPKPRWEIDIEPALKEMGWEGVGWICSA